MSDLPPYLYFAGFIVLTIAVVYTQYRLGAKKISTEVITNYEILDKQQKDIIAEKDKKIAQYQTDMADIKSAMSRMKEDFASQLGKVQGQLDAKDKELASLRATILNPSLNLGQILTEIRDFMKEIREANIYQTDILEEQRTREKSIDKRDKNLAAGRTGA